MSGPALKSGWLRIAIAASDEAEESRLAALVEQLGHELVQLDAFPDAWLSDGTVDGASTSPEVALGSPAEDAAGNLPKDASALQVDAALHAVAVGLRVRLAAGQRRNFEPLPDEARVALTPREIEVLAALGKGLSNKAAARCLGISPYGKIPRRIPLQEARSRVAGGGRGERAKAADRRALTAIVFAGRAS